MRIIEVGDSVESAKAARVLLQLGNDVTKIEDFAQTQTLRGAQPGTPAYLHLALDPGKHSLALNFAHTDAVELLRAVAAHSDGAVVAHGPARELWQRAGIGPMPPSLIFDEAAPFCDGYARTGHMIAYGDAAREPLAGPPSLPALFAGVAAVMPFYAAVLAGGGEAHAQTTRTMAALYPKSNADVSYRGIDATRGGRGPRGYHPAANYACKDGYVSLLPLSDEKSLTLLRLAGHPEATTDDRFVTNAARLANHQAYDALLAPWLQISTRDEVVAACQAEGIPSGAIQTVSDYLDDRQPKARQFFTVAEDGHGREYRLAGLPDGRGNPAAAARVPALGEHTRPVLGAAGFTASEIADLFARGVVA